MGRIVYVMLLILYFAATCAVYREELKPKIPMDKLKGYGKNLEKELNKWVMTKNSVLLDRELFSSNVILKNLSLVRRETPLSADYIYENLMENSNLLKPFYGEMLALYRSGKDEEAFKVFTIEIGTKAARNFAMILSKVDKVNPAELVEQMEIFQQMMMENNTTVAMKRAQRNSMIIMSCAASAVFALLINFSVVVVFMDTINTLNNMFL